MLKQFVRWGIYQGIPRAVMQRAARGGDLQGRLIQGAATRHTFELIPLFDELRAAGPLRKGSLSYMTGHHQAVHEVLSSNDFSTGIRDAMGMPALARLAQWSDTDVFDPTRAPSLLATEPPDHTRYRKLVTRVFTVRAVEQLRERTQAIADQLLDELEAAYDGSTVDIVARYCGLLPVTVISEILGVPTADRELVLQLGELVAPSLDLGLPYGEYRRVESGLRRFDDWLTGHLEALRRQPGDNLLSKLVAAQDDDGVALDEFELKATAGLVLAAGFETTVNLLGNGIALLAEHPDQLALLREQPELWGNAVDEILRYDPPVLLTGRVSTADTTVMGVRVARGTLVTTVLAAANRDPAVFDDPGVFDVTRHNAREHVSFSAGRHYCLGAALARMEGEVGLTTLFDRYPDLRLQPGATRRATRILRGYHELPVSPRPVGAPVG